MQTPTLDIAPPEPGPRPDAPAAQRLDRPASRRPSTICWVMLGLLAGILLTAGAVAALALWRSPVDLGPLGPLRDWKGGSPTEVAAEDEPPAPLLPVRIALDPPL